jgi:hypothetical protein
MAEKNYLVKREKGERTRKISMFDPEIASTPLICEVHPLTYLNAATGSGECPDDMSWSETDYHKRRFLNRHTEYGGASTYCKDKDFPRNE